MLAFLQSKKAVCLIALCKAEQLLVGNAWIPHGEPGIDVKRCLIATTVDVERTVNSNYVQIAAY